MQQTQILAAQHQADVSLKKNYKRNLAYKTSKITTLS